MHPRPPSGPISRGSERDQALSRLRRMTKWLGAASVAAVGAVALYVAHTTPGRAAPASGTPATAPPPTTAPPTTSAPAASSPATSAPTTTPPAQLSPPPTVPQQTTRHPHVVSGSTSY
jgi:hypothetical protein